MANWEKRLTIAGFVFLAFAIYVGKHISTTTGLLCVFTGVEILTL
jgi:hypothetical protein